MRSANNPTAEGRGNLSRASTNMSVRSDMDAPREVKGQQSCPNNKKYSLIYFLYFLVVMVGESGVGKSSLTIRFVSNHFKEHGQPTIGASFLSKTLSLQTGGSIKYNIWDTAGQEKYRSLASLYYRGVDIAIIVYDITNRVSYFKK